MANLAGAHGYYSATQARIVGVAIYVTTDGRQVRVTEVSHGQPWFPDAIDCGEVERLQRVESWGAVDWRPSATGRWLS